MLVRGQLIAQWLLFPSSIPAKDSIKGSGSGPISVTLICGDNEQKLLEALPVSRYALSWGSWVSYAVRWRQIGKARWRIAPFLRVWQLGKPCLRGESLLSAEDGCCFLGNENVRHNVSWLQKIRSLLLDQLWWPFQNPAFEIYFPIFSNASRLSVTRSGFWLEKSCGCCSTLVFLLRLYKSVGRQRHVGFVLAVKWPSGRCRQTFPGYWFPHMGKEFAVI